MNAKDWVLFLFFASPYSSPPSPSAPAFLLIVSTEIDSMEERSAKAKHSRFFFHFSSFKRAVALFVPSPPLAAFVLVV